MAINPVAKGNTFEEYIQEVRDLPYRLGTLKFTTAHYYLPDGRNLNRISGSDMAPP